MSLPSFTFIALSIFTFISYPCFAQNFPYGSQQVRGVNLGGWLVLEVIEILARCSPLTRHHFRLAMDHSKPL
jgi:hypothetical protein